MTPEPRRSTGSWVVRMTTPRGDCWLRRAGSFLSWGDEPDALVFSTKTAAVKAVRNSGRAFDATMTVERSWSHEESARTREDFR